MPSMFAQRYRFLVLGTVLLVLIGRLHGEPGQPAAYLESLERAGKNRSQLEAFVVQASRDHGEFGGRAARFLIRFMSEGDLQSLDLEFLSENLNYAIRAKAEFPWGEAIPESIFLNDVLPYASLDEPRERWRPGLYETSKAIVADSETIAEAVQSLNRELFNVIDVHYNTGRKRPNQSPSESIKQGRATCTGLSIILVDACRAVGIPARITGTPLWTNQRGNHTWTEVWDQDWHFTGSDEYDAKGLDRGWFVGAASEAIKSDPRYAIYSTSWQTADAYFPMVWSRGDRSVHAVNTTDRYTGDRVNARPADANELFVRVRETKGGVRIQVKAELVDGSNQSVSSVVTKAGRADMNDIAALSCRPDRLMWLRFTKGDETKQIPIRRWSRDSVTLDLAWNEIPSRDQVASFQLAGLKTWLAVPAVIRPDSIPGSVLKGSLSKSDARRAVDLLWAKEVEEQREDREQELAAKAVSAGGHTLRFKERSFGSAPEGRRSLWISLHGGGGAPPAVNDRQWANQITLYEPEEGYYVAPRAPTDTWNLWHQDHIDPLVQRLIETFVICRGVDPNRVYLMGYSAGGDGVFQLGPRMADRFAAVAMMAGHPNETQPTGLRNLPFALFMGADDSAYNRNEKAAEWRDELKRLRSNDPGGYPHMVKIYPDTGHWMKRRDREALPWMKRYVRVTWPKQIEWLQDDVIHDRFYWLGVDRKDGIPRSRVSARISGQTIHLRAEDVPEVKLRLSDALLDLDLPVVVKSESRVLFKGRVDRTIEAIRESLAERADPVAAATAVLTVPLAAGKDGR